MKHIASLHSSNLTKGIVLAVALAAATSGAQAVTVDLGTLSINSTSSADLQDNSMIIRTTSFAVIEGYVATGYNAGTWDGFGIKSSTAGSFVFPSALGTADNTDASWTTFNSIAIGVDDVLIRYTWYGDADLSGKVDNDDYALLDAGFGIAANKWFLGDFDYNNLIDNDDYAIIDAGFGGQGAPLGGGGALLVGGGKGGGLVPEPTSLALLLTAAVGFVSRRRR